jgi:catechol 2,3-dioxygenase-like lactoylglutathione lyase family enzyme
MRTLLAATLALASIGAAQAPPPASIAYRPTLLIQLGVSNLDRAIRFYTETLGFEMTERRNDLKFAHIATNVPGLEIGLNEVADPKGTGSVVLNIGVADIIAARKTLEARGVVFRGETAIIPGKVALAAFADPDGNTLRFAGPPPKRAGEVPDARYQVRIVKSKTGK